MHPSSLAVFPSSQTSVPDLGSSSMFLAFHANPFGFCGEKKAFSLNAFHKIQKDLHEKQKKRKSKKK